MKDFPPVEPVERPERFSQTLLRHFDRCQRSAYLYVKHKGGAPSHDMDRGTCFHLFAEKATRLLIEQEEERLPPEIAKDLMAEVIAEHPELTVPVEEQDRLRVMAYHFAEEVWIDPARVVAVERKFVLPLGDTTVSGKVDFASMSEDGLSAEVIDWKTSYSMTSYDELATKFEDGRLAGKAFQLLLYVLLLAYGHPVSERRCHVCHGEGRHSDPPVPCGRCDASGVIEYPEPFPLGERVQVFTASELYPQYLFEDGLGRREVSVTRAELPDHRTWLEGLVAKLARAFETWEFPAVPGSHCTSCPAKAECPIPEQLRDFAGEIETPEQAEQVAALIHVNELNLKARRADLKGYANFEGPIRFGDMLWEFSEETRRSTDYDALQAAVERAVEYGEAFDVGDYIKTSTSTLFKKRRLSADELQPEPEPALSADEKWGAEAPF